MIHTTLDSPIGPLLLAGDGTRLTKIGFPQGKGRVSPEPGWTRDDAAFAEVRRQLDGFLAGRRRTFDVPLDLRGTPFQLAVWGALTAIPFGETISYGELARRIGRPTASRAVGAANGVNPIPIIVPCHRVIGADKGLTGFGGGIETKRWLLGLEAGKGVDGMPQGRLL